MIYVHIDRWMDRQMKDRQTGEWIDRQKDEHSSETALIKDILAKYETIKIRIFKRII